jgi:hypothetical protein
MKKKAISFTQACLKRKRVTLPALLLIIVVVALACSLGRNSTSKSPGIYLTGRVKNIRLNTPYTYQVEIVSGRSYKNAVIVFNVPESSYRKIDKVNLPAHQAVVRDFTTTFQITKGMKPDGIAVTVFLSPTAKNQPSTLLFGKGFAVSPTNPVTTGPLPKSSSSPTSSVMGE